MDISKLSSRLTEEEMKELKGLHKTFQHRFVPDTFEPCMVVLIISDDETMAVASQKLLQDGFSVCDFKTATDALGVFEKVDPIPESTQNWVIADETNGFELLKAMKEKEGLKAMRMLIVVQTYNDMEVIQKVYAQGAHGLMTKDYFTTD